MPKLTCIGTSFTRGFFVNHDMTDVAGPIDYGDLGTLINWGTPNMATVGEGFNLRGNPLQTLEIGNLKSVGGDLRIFDSLTSNFLSTAQYQALENIGGIGYLVTNCSGIYSLTAPVLVTVASGVVASNNVLLNSVSLPVFLPTNGTNGDFSNNNLDTASVNHILSRYVASSGYVSGTLNLGGGTNASPTGQGVTEKNTLITRGVIVITN